MNLPNFPKLSSDQIKKVALSTMGFVFLLYVYFTFFLGPLEKSRNGALMQIDEMQKKISGSKGEIAKTASLERQARDATARFNALKTLTPDGAPIAWFPPRMKAFFSNQQIDKASARLESNTSFKESDLSGWAKYNWVIELPQADFVALGKAISDLENQEPLLSITKLSMHVLINDPQLQQVSIAATTVIEKR